MSAVVITEGTLKLVQEALQCASVLTGTIPHFTLLEARDACIQAAAALAHDLSPIGQMTDREREVFALVGAAKDKHEIAAELGMSIKTVDVHKHNIRAKLGLPNTRMLMVAAVRYVDGLAKAKDSAGEGSES